MENSYRRRIDLLQTLFAWILFCFAAFIFILDMAHLTRIGVHAIHHLGHEFIRDMVESVLDGFVLLELLRSFADYLQSRRLHISLLLETALVFVLREMSTTLYSGHYTLGTMSGYAILVSALIFSWHFARKDDSDEDELLQKSRG